MRNIYNLSFCHRGIVSLCITACCIILLSATSFAHNDESFSFSNSDHEAEMAIPVNDECLAATAIPVNPGCCEVADVTIDISLEDESGIIPSCMNEAGDDPDAWYTFTPSVDGNIHFESFGTFQGSNEFAVWDACEGNEIACGSGDWTFYGANAGQQYWLQVWRESFQTNDLVQFCLGEFEEAANDMCANAEELVVQGPDDCTISVSVEILTGSESGEVPGCMNPSGEDPDLWYKFTPSVSGNIRFQSFGTFQGSNEFAIYDACAGTELVCGNGDWTFFGAVAGTEYILQVWREGSFKNDLVEFCISEFAQAPNDDCADAEEIIVQGPADCTISVSVDIRSGSESGAEPSCMNTSGEDPDLWYKFTPSVTGNIRIQSFGTYQGSNEFAVWDACLGTELACGNGDWTFFDVVAGTTYWLQVWRENSFDLDLVEFCLAEFPEAPNDNCANAEEIIVQGPADCTISVSVDIRSGSESGAVPSCMNASGEDPDLWYKFTPSVTGNIRIQSFGTYQGSNEFAVWDACLGTELACGSGDWTFFDVVAGTTYWLQVWRENSFDLDLVEFCLSEFPEQSNDECANSEPVEVQLPDCTVSVSFDIRSADPSDPENAPSCMNANGDDPDLWYSFVSPLTGVVNFNSFGTFQGSNEFAIYDACDGTELHCANGTFDFPDAVQGVEYLVRVWRETSFDAHNVEFCIQTCILECPEDENIEWPSDFNTADVSINTPQDPSITPAGPNDFPDLQGNCVIVSTDYQDVINGPNPANCPGALWTVTRSWTLTDAAGNTYTCVQTFNFSDNTPPDLVIPVDITIECDESSDPDNTGMASATDNCGVPDVTFTDATVADPNCANGFAIIRSWTATDFCENQVQLNQLITIQDKTAPVLDPCPADVTVSCASEVPDAPELTANDVCEGQIIATLAEDPFGTDCNGGIVRTYTATDACGNSTSCFYTVTIRDLTAPVFTECPEDLTLDCNADTSPDAVGHAVATDNCAGGGGGDVIFINEFHYDNSGGDVGEGVEVAGTAGLDLTGYSIILYNGSNGTTYDTEILTGSIDDEGDGSGAVWFAITGIQNGGPDGIALLNPANEILEFISYEGSFTATNGPASGLASTDVGVTETSSTPIGESIQRTGSGSVASDFSWSGPAVGSPGDLNSGQTVNSAIASDVTVTFEDEITEGDCGNEMTIERLYTAVDGCGNVTEKVFTIELLDVIPPDITFCPADVFLSCGDDTSPAMTGTAGATDACSGVTVSYNDVTFGNCPDDATIERTWSATDDCDNASTCLQIITVSGEQITLTIDCPADATINCDEDTSPANTGEAVVDGNCPFGVFQDYTDVIVPGPCPNQYTIERTFIAFDECDNFEQCVQTISIVDTQAPVFTSVPSDVTIECDESTSAMAQGIAMATDNCSELVENVLFINEIHYDNSGGDTGEMFEVAGTAGQDLDGYSVFLYNGSGGASYDIIPLGGVLDDEGNGTGALSFSAPGMQNGPDGLALVDPMNHVVEFISYEGSFTASGGPADGMVSVDIGVSEPGAIGESLQKIGTGTTASEFTWTGPVAESPGDLNSGQTLNLSTDSPLMVTTSDVVTPGNCPGQFSVERTFTATDACGLEVSHIQVITVQDSQFPTIVDCPADMTVECASDIPAQSVVTATDNCGDVTVTMSQDPFGDACTGGIVYIWTAVDGCGQTTTCSQTISYDDQTVPVFTSTPADVVITCGDDTSPANTGMASATDNCQDVTVAHNDVITGMCPDDATIERTFTASDGCGNEAEYVQIIAVTGEDVTCTIVCPADPPEPIEWPADFDINQQPDPNQPWHPSIDPGQFGSANFAGDCPDYAIVFQDELVGPNDCPTPWTVERHWILLDPSGAPVGECIQTFVFSDFTDPGFDFCPGDIAIECGDPYDPSVTGMATATDNCGVPDVTFEDVTIAGQCPFPLLIVRTWTATDLCLNTSQCTQSIQIVDSTPPTIIDCPADMTVECASDIPAQGIVSATDACGDVTITTNEDPFGDACSGGGIVYIWTATDACGNESICTQTISYSEDETPPVFIDCPEDMTVECAEDVPAPGSLTATDNCGDVTVTLEQTNGDNCAGNVTYVWKAVDDCNNASFCTQTFTLTPPDQPELSGCPMDLTVECFSDVPAQEDIVTATSGCVDVTVTFQPSFISGDPCSGGTVTYGWQATDDCGNINSCNQEITYRADDISPTFVDCPADMTVECASDIPAQATVSATDNCGDVTVTMLADPFGDECTGGIVYVWIAVDECGMTTTCSQTISYDDQTPPVFTSSPADVVITCGDDTSPANTGMATATDNCQDVTVAHSDVITGMCPDDATIERTFTALDGCGNEAEYIQIITVIPADVTCTIVCPQDPPEPIEWPADFDLNANPDPNQPWHPSIDPQVFGFAQLAGNCPDYFVSFQDFLVGPDDCPTPYTVIREWRLHDPSGAVVTVCNQTFVYTDTTPPTIVDCPVDMTVECASDLPAQATVTATDACGDVTVTMLSDPFGDDCTGGIVYVWIATDPCGLTTTCSQTISYDDQTAPVFTDCPADMTVACAGDIPAQGLVTATDNCGDVTITTNEDPFGDTCSGGGIVYVWTATDACGNATNCIQTISYPADVTPPTITDCPADLTVECASDIPAQATVSATDNCGDVTITMSQDPFGDECTGGIVYVWTAVDECGQSMTCSQTISYDDQTPPVFTSTPADVIITCGDDTSPANTGMAAATDNCQDVTVAHSDVITGMCPDDATIERTFTASDGCGNESVHVQIITVNAADVTCTVVCPPSPQEPIEWPSNFNLDQAGPDEPQDPSISPDIYGSPDLNGNCQIESITFQDILIGPNLNACEGGVWIVIRNWVVTDADGNQYTCVQEFSFKDTTPPTFIDCPEDITVECIADIPAQANVSATDNCGDVTITSFVAIIDFFDPCRSGFVYTWFAEDACGNVSDCSQTVIQIDDQGPVFTSECPEDITVECAADIPPMGMMTATDNCGDVTVTPAIAIIDFFDPCRSGFIYTWFAEDGCGNVTSCSQTVIQIDDEGPVFDQECPEDVTVDCIDDIPAQITMTATDNCGDVTVTTGLAIIDFFDPCRSGFIYTWFAEDGCGNVTSCSQTVIQIDDEGPVFDQECPADMTIECDEDLPVQATLTATDNCGDVTVTTGLAIIDYFDPCIIGYLYIWTAQDACGNITSCSQQITVVDTEAPVFTSTPGDVTINCGDDTSPANTGMATATDNCQDVTITHTDVITGMCPDDATIERTFTADDGCGNASTHIQIITVNGDDVTCELICPPSPDEPIECFDLINFETGEISPDFAPEAIYGTATLSGDCADYSLDFHQQLIIVQGNNPDCPELVLVRRWWILLDPAGNEVDVCYQDLEVADTTPPEIYCTKPAPLFCVDEAPTAEWVIENGPVIAMDNCDDDPEIFWIGPAELSMGCMTTLTWQFYAVDNCGNVSDTCETVVQFWMDPTPPTIECLSDEYPHLGCNPANKPTPQDLVNQGYVTALDNCGPVAIGALPTIDTAVVDCDTVLTYYFKASDLCNQQSAVCSVNVRWTVNTEIQLECPDDLTIDCADVSVEDLIAAWIEDLTVSDYCNDITVTNSYDPDAFTESCVSEKYQDVTFTVVDDCGEVATCVSTIWVLDTEAPEITCPDDITANADKFFCEKENVVVGFPTITDNCDETYDVTVSRDDGLDLSDSYPVGVTTITWIVKGDCSELSDTCEQTITIVDSQPPTVICNKISISLNDDGGMVEVPADVLYDGVFDNCTGEEALLPTITVSQTQFDCSDYPEVLVEICATDEAGNIGCCYTTVKIQDVDAPDAVCQDVTVEMLNGSVMISATDVDGGSTDNSDDCDIELDVSPNVFVTVGNHDVTLTVTDIAGNTSTCSAVVTVIPPQSNNSVQISAKVWFEGPMNVSQTAMIPTINDLLPLDQPFNTAPFNYAGSEMLPAIPANMIDWVLLQVRDQSDPTVILRQRAALLMSDGYIVELNGQTPVNFSDLNDGSYYVSVIHRNHLEVVSDAPIVVLSGQGLHDFTNGSAMGTEPMKLMTNGQYAMWCGDLNSDGVIDAGDRSIAWNQRNQTGYLKADATMDGIVDASERSVTWNNRNKSSGIPE